MCSIRQITPALFFGDTPWLKAITGQSPVFDGIWPAVTGTVLLVFLSSAIAVPVGIASGIYLAAYASCRQRAFLGSMVDLLSGTPSIVMGLFGFTMILFLRKTVNLTAQTGLFLAAVCIALLILPYLIRTSQAAIAGISTHLRLIGPAAGFSTWQNIRHVLLPLASRGILSGIILAVGRASEDTAVILLTGVVAQSGIPRNIWDKFEALPFRIYYLAAEHRNATELEQGFAVALVLLVSLLLKLKERYTILAVSHSLSQTRRIADRVCVLRQGQLIQEMDRNDMADVTAFQGLMEAAF